MPNRRRRCRSCREWFIPARSTQWVCSPECALAKVKSDGEKVVRKKIREAKIRNRTRGDWQREAQKAFNRFIRARDNNLPCVSCGRFHQGQWHAGHFRSTGSSPALRFDEANCHKQCSPCNNYLHGNLAKYREELLVRIGPEELARLEGPQEPKKYSIEELKVIRAKYLKLAKEMEAQ
jgi:hypothetical protein